MIKIEEQQLADTIRIVLIHQFFAAMTDSLPIGIIRDPSKQALYAYRTDSRFQARVDIATACLMTELSK